MGGFLSLLTLKNIFALKLGLMQKRHPNIFFLMKTKAKQNNIHNYYNLFMTPNELKTSDDSIWPNVDLDIFYAQVFQFLMRTWLSYVYLFWEFYISGWQLINER